MKDISRFCIQGWGFWKGWYWTIRFAYACMGIRLGRRFLPPGDWRAVETQWTAKLSAIAQALYADMLSRQDDPGFSFEYVRNVHKGVQAMSRLSGVPIMMQLPRDPHRLKGQDPSA